MTLQTGTGSGSSAWNQAWYVCTSLARKTAHGAFHLIRYQDVATAELVVSFERYVAKGDIFIRTLGISDGNSPITIGLQYCSPEGARSENARLTFGFTVINCSK